MWRTDGKGGYTQVQIGEPLSSSVFVARGGRLSPLSPLPTTTDAAKVSPKRGLALFAQRIKYLLKEAA
jgi:hypothetical protein